MPFDDKSPGPGEAGCPLCGDPVPASEVELIEETMDNVNATCISCGRLFGDARDECGLPEL